MISLIIHEVSHAMIAMYFDVVVLGFGVNLKKSLPHGYTDILWSSIELNKKVKISIYLAGILAHLQLAGIAFMIVRVIEGGYQFAFLIFGMTNIVLVLSNIQICGNSDGTLILYEVLKESDKRILKKYKEKNITFNMGQGKITLSKEEIIIMIYFVFIFCFVLRGGARI